VYTTVSCKVIDYGCNVQLLSDVLTSCCVYCLQPDANQNGKTTHMGLLHYMFRIFHYYQNTLMVNNAIFHATLNVDCV